MHAGPLIADGAQVADDVSFGAFVVVHAGCRIGSGCAIEDHVVLGKAPKLAPASQARGRELGPLELGGDVSVGAGAVLFAGAQIGAGAIVGDQSYVRERARIGERSLIGRGSVVDNDVSVGDRVRIQTSVYLTAFTTVEDDAFVGPGVICTNDNTMGRHGRDFALRGPHIGRASRIGGGAVLAPGIRIGAEAYVAAGAVVVADVPERAVVMGVPARVVREVRDEDLLERWR